MTNGHPSADIEAMVSPIVPEIGREQLRVRRRRARAGHHGSRGSASARWVAASRSRRRAVRTFVLCASVLLLMAVGLYFGLAHQENAAPVEGAVRVGALGTVGTA